MMTDENKKDDGFLDDSWLIEDDEDVIEPSNMSSGKTVLLH